MQHLEVSCAVRPLKWSLGVKWLSATGWKALRYITSLVIFGATRILTTSSCSVLLWSILTPHTHTHTHTHPPNSTFDISTSVGWRLCDTVFICVQSGNYSVHIDILVCQATWYIQNWQFIQSVTGLIWIVVAMSGRNLDNYFGLPLCNKVYLNNFMF